MLYPSVPSRSNFVVREKMMPAAVEVVVVLLFPPILPKGIVLLNTMLPISGVANCVVNGSQTVVLLLLVLPATKMEQRRKKNTTKRRL